MSCNEKIILLQLLSQSCHLPKPCLKHSARQKGQNWLQGTSFGWHLLRHGNNNNQVFYSQASWGRLEMKSHEQKKTRTKQERKRMGKTKGDKKSNKKRRKDNKTLSQKSEKGWKKT
jgi:hypothetical protein